MPKLSVIVPVYNVENYLDECVSSVVAQTFSEFEVLLVDDGSTDSSGRKCEEWAKKDKRITVYHKKNGGLMSAWKYGVTKATGEYIGFVDSDDWIDKDMYQRMFGIAEEQQADVVCAALVFEETNGEKRFERRRLRQGFYGKTEIEKEVYPVLFASEQFKTRGLSPNRVTKLYKRDMLISVLEDCDENVSIGEDLLATFAFMQRAKSMYLFGDYYPYHYRMNNASMIREFNRDKYGKIDLLKAALLRVNAKYGGYDFSEQIHTDYIDLYLRQMETEILSTAGYREIKKRLKESFGTENVQKALALCNLRMLRHKHRMYLFLLKNKLYGLLITIRKAKKC